jgi:predicted permease
VIEFAAAFGAAWLAILKVVLVIVVSGFLVRRGILTQNVVTGMSQATIVLFLPCLIFSKVIQNLDPSIHTLWWALPVAGLAMPMVGLGAAALLFARELPAKRDMLALASMQNAGYLVLPVGYALFPDQFDRFALYCFLFILGFNILLWSIGKALVSDGDNRGWKSLITPPLVANVAAVVIVLSGTDRFVPSILLDAVDLTGKAAVPVATAVLGALLGSVTVRFRGYVWDGIRALGIKLVFLPALTILAVWFATLETTDPLLARFLILEAAAAPAAGLILQVRTYGGDEQKVGSLMLFSYVASMITMPLWLAVWEVVNL